MLSDDRNHARVCPYDLCLSSNERFLVITFTGNTLPVRPSPSHNCLEGDGVPGKMGRRHFTKRSCDTNCCPGLWRGLSDNLVQETEKVFAQYDYC